MSANGGRRDTYQAAGGDAPRVVLGFPCPYAGRPLFFASPRPPGNIAPPHSRIRSPRASVRNLTYGNVMNRGARMGPPHVDDEGPKPLAQVLPIAPRYPDPPVPAHVDLRGMAWMPLHGAILFGSDFDAMASDFEFRVALNLWWAAWNQVPAASLPDDDARIAILAGFGRGRRAISRFRRVKAVVMHKFSRCNDGRLYHEFLATEALEAWARRSAHTERREHEADRQRRHRDERKALFSQLKAVGVVPPWDTKTDELRALVATHYPPTGNATGHGPVTRTATAIDKTGQDRTVTTTSKDASPNGDVSPPTSSSPTCPPCPHDEIVAAYHEALPGCPRVREWNDARKRKLRSLWRERVELGKFATVPDGVAYFRRYFAKVGRSSFLTGRGASTPERPAFCADLEWLVTRSHFVRVIEGRYDDA